MKKKEKKLLFTKTIVELDKQLNLKREELLRAQLTQHEDKDKNKIKTIRHDIARILTIRAQKQQEKK